MTESRLDPTFEPEVFVIRPNGSLICQPRATPWEADPQEQLSPERAEQLLFMISFVRLS